MTLKIERSFVGRGIRIRLSGQLRSGHLSHVRSEIEGAGEPVALDLEEVDLIDLDGVRFLNECESVGIPVLQCSPYVREWMQRERSQIERPMKRE